MFGIDKKIEANILDLGFFDVTKLEIRLLNYIKSIKPAGSDSNSENDSKGKSKNAQKNKMELNVEMPYKAPELVGIEGWINSNGEKISDLKGKVVLIDFWTYSCINCIRTLPYIAAWYEKYKDKGLVIIGVHSPEFAFERNIKNVQKAVSDFKVTYPVALDNNFFTWRAYENQYWPAEYFIDKKGFVRHTHFGEGSYAETEDVIRYLLSEDGTDLTGNKVVNSQVTVPISVNQTPETYLGYKRASSFLNYYLLKKDTSEIYKLAYSLASDLSSMPSDSWTVGGTWKINSENIISDSDDAVLEIKFSAKDLYLVMGSETEQTVEVTVYNTKGELLNSTLTHGDDVSSTGVVKVKDYRLYKLVHFPEFSGNAVDAILRLKVPKGVELNAFTFGS